MDIQSKPVSTLSTVGITVQPHSPVTAAVGSSSADSQDELRRMLVTHSKAGSPPKPQKIISAPNPISEQDELYASDSTKSLPEGAAHLQADKSGMMFDSISLPEGIRHSQLVPDLNMQHRATNMLIQEPHVLQHSLLAQQTSTRNKQHAELQQVAGAIPRVRDCVADYLITGRDALIQDLCKTKSVRFTDPEFPPCASSLLGESSDTKSHSQVSLLNWARIGDIFGNPQMRIYEDISPTDILTGPLGVNYLLSAIGLLAERPTLIRRLFNSDTLQLDSVYVVWLFINGQWREVIIDDYVPIFQEDDKTVSLAFSRTFEDQAWLPLLEKAYAKVYGGYKMIEGGHFADALRDLAGGTIQSLTLSDFHDQDQLWTKLQESLNRDHLVGAVVKDVSVAAIQNPGEHLILDHTCNILNAMEITHPSDGSRHKIVQIRTMSAHIEWKGLWSYESRIWTQELRDRYCKLSEQDGVFWIPFEVLLTQIEEFTVLKLNSTASFWNSLEVDGNHSEPSCEIAVNLEIFKQGEYTISLDQVDSRLLGENHTYSFVRVILARVFEDGKTVEHKACTLKSSKTISLEGELSPGKYALLLEIYWTQRESRIICINSQGPQMVGITRVHLSLNDFKQLMYQSLRDFVVACPKFVLQKEITVSDDINTVKIKDEHLDLSREIGRASL